MPNKIIYPIDGFNFPIETIGLIGIVTEDEKFCWAMDIYAGENEIDGHQVEPKFSFTELQSADTFEFDKSFQWNNTQAYSSEKEDWVGSFYIFDAHNFEAKVSLEKLNQKEFWVTIIGRVDLSWATVEQTDFKSFHIENAIPFNGIISEIEDKKKAFEIVSKYLDTNEMKWLPKEETSSGEDNWITF